MVWGWGNNRYLQCGLPLEWNGNALIQIDYALYVEFFKDNSLKIMDVACGWNHNLVLSTDDKVYAFGKNDYGQCGVELDENVNMTTPVLVQGLDGVKVMKIRCGANHSVVQGKDGKWFMFGKNDKNQCLTGDGRQCVNKAFCINEIVERESKGKIKQVLLGVDNTQIVVSNDDNTPK